MRFYEVECRAVITLAEQDMEKAGLHVAALFKDYSQLIHVRAIHEKNFEPAWEGPGSEKQKLQKGRILTLDI